LGIGLSIAAIFMTLNTLQKQPVQAYKKQLKDLEKKLNNRAAKYRAKKVESTEPTSNLDDIFQFLFGGKKQKSSRNSLTQTKGPFKSRKDKVISGVIGGLAQSWGVNPFYLRLIVLCLIPFTSGIIIPIYIASSLLMPKEPTIE
ncbi:MAG: PspC domain-containing protein, partial [Bacteroidia bacterium]|nr:PspC domain-containing protein [Bacteroidia bacterium]